MHAANIEGSEADVEFRCFHHEQLLEDLPCVSVHAGVTQQRYQLDRSIALFGDCQCRVESTGPWNGRSEACVRDSSLCMTADAAVQSFMSAQQHPWLVAC